MASDITLSRCNKSWTKEEELYLEENWGTVSIPTIAKNLNRNVNGIKIKAYKLGLGSFLLGGDYISLNQLVIAVTGHIVNSYQNLSWIKNRGLPVHKKRIHNNTFRVVYLKEFWEWAEKNRSFVDFSKMEPLALGEEPKWVAEQRRKDYQVHSLQRKTPWTPMEDQQLLRLLKKQKYSFMELSEILHRSTGAIQRRCTDLGTKYRPIKADNHSKESKWTDEHYRILAEGIKNGDGYALLSKKIGKSEKAIRGKVYTVYLTENADKVRFLLKNGNWGEGAPTPTVRQAKHLSGMRSNIRKELSVFAGLLKYRMNQLGYDPYWQRFMCVNWDDLDGCAAGCDSCDTCKDFLRIRAQYCKRCGTTFYEHKSNDFCNECRTARRKQAQKKWAIINNRR